MAELQALAAGQERLSYKLEVADRSLPRLLRTVAHLRPGQVAQRLRLSSRRALWSRMGTRVDARYRARAARLPPLPFDHAGLARVASLRCGRSGSEEALAVAGDARAGRFTFLDVTREFGAEVDWYRPDLDEGTRLWKTLLHEFPYALDLARAHVESGDPGFRRALLALVRGWADASPIGRPGFALDAWNARAVSHRLVHWAVAGSLLELAADDPDAAFLGNAIALQAVFLRDNLEWDLRGNHLLSDLVALVLAHQLLGCAPEALALLQRQIEEQVLADGCHVERVPLYHALALRDLCETRAVLGEAAPAWLEDAIARMAGYLEWLLPADGRLPLFGDSWHGEVDSRRTLEEASARRIAPDVATAAAASGLLALRRGEAHAVVRAGAHGPDWQLGHAHADALSFELSLGRDRVVTDTGTPTYDAGARRARALSTAAHNTLQIDGEEQIECWGSFRVGRRGRAGVRAAGATADWQWLWASYDGWRWLSGRPEHHRLLALSPQALVVLDVVTGGGRHRLRSALHLHPELPAGRAGAFALGRPARRISAALHERFNATRESTELFVEEDARLPWAGGWIVTLGDAREPSNPELHMEEGTLRMRCRLPSAGFEVTWHFGGTSTDAAVRIVACPPSGPSAT